MEADFEFVRCASLRGYELARFRLAAFRGLLAASAVALFATLLFETGAWMWAPATFLVVTLTEWRGLDVMRGARRGLVAGFASMLLPLSVLRPCCGIDCKAAGIGCCTMPSACWGVGALVGLAMALALPQSAPGKRVEAAIGMVLGVTAVAVSRCSMLFFGEAVGLLGGMAAGVAASTIARSYLQRRAT